MTSGKVERSAPPPESVGAHLHKLLEILLLSRFVYSPKYIYLFRYLFISVWTQGFLFYTLVL